MKKTVLVVEDDFDTQHPLAEILTLRGFSPVTASDAERALVMARSSPPDLIITDLLLPGKNGLHLIQGVRNSPSLKSVPIIVISGCEPYVLAEARRMGANHCFEKPIRFERFWETVDLLLGRANGEEPSPASFDSGRASANRIDDLIERLRRCSSDEERAGVLRTLKEQILGRSKVSGRV
ncbi:MAG TPA: response regulator [Blastocatellia bacterium]|jgi:DNA-binding response OmpR family regulator|nr:response regulator [Blastocatellia bacterium]